MAGNEKRRRKRPWVKWLLKGLLKGLVFVLVLHILAPVIWSFLMRIPFLESTVAVIRETQEWKLLAERLQGAWEPISRLLSGLPHTVVGIFGNGVATLKERGMTVFSLLNRPVVWLVAGAVLFRDTVQALLKKLWFALVSGVKMLWRSAEGINIWMNQTGWIIHVSGNRRIRISDQTWIRWTEDGKEGLISMDQREIYMGEGTMKLVLNEDGGVSVYQNQKLLKIMYEEDGWIAPDRNRDLKLKVIRG
ncbi:MAG: hypothetical protein Q4B85_01970 [Lachnospiraceae bacterium]|nr:hypothetical protein [Lachnospiraceae bacterium]